MKQKCYLIFNIVFVVLFFLIFIGSIISNQSICFTTSNPLFLILSMLIVITLWTFFYKLLSKIEKWNIKTELTVVILIFALIIGIQVFCAHFLKVTPSWDFGMIYDNAVNYARLGSQAKISGYFAMCPNNTFPLYVLAIIYRVLSKFHFYNFMSFSIGLNILSIDVALLGMYLIIRKLINVKTAIFSTIVTIFISPLFLYTPIFYTDTLSMAFPIWLFYLYLNRPKDDAPLKKIMMHSIIFSLLLFLGFEMKMTCIIIVIAILIEEILSKKILLNKKLYVCISIFFIVVLGIYSIINNKLTSNWDRDKSLPYIHYVMMGTSKTPLSNNKYAYGIFNDDDLKYTTSFDTKEKRIENDKKLLKERLKNYRFVGSIDFFYKKALQTFGDGTYFAPEKLRRSPIEKNYLHNIYLVDGKYFSYYFYYAEGVQLSLLLLLSTSGLSALRKKEDKTNIIRVAIFGLLLFLTIWEARSRYLINYIPIIVIGAIVGFTDIYNYIEKKVGK